MLNSDENRNLVISVFPKLGGDVDFKIIDGPTPDYNCFAWAANHDDVFWQPIPKEKRPLLGLDGVSYNWPFDAAEDTKLTTIISIFSKIGYEECNDGVLEDGLRKVALYGTKDNITHAARQLVTGKDRGKWTSKLGQWFKINHGDATTIEGKDYGNVIKYLRMPFP
jgi:hypothetical protein